MKIGMAYVNVDEKTQEISCIIEYNENFKCLNLDKIKMPFLSNFSLFKKIKKDRIFNRNGGDNEKQ